MSLPGEDWLQVLGPFSPPSFAAERLPFVLWLFVAVAAIGAVGWYLFQGWRLHCAMVNGTSALKKHDAQATFESLPQIEADFESNGLLKPHWREFSASLVKDDETATVLTTTDAGAFFNEVSLVDRPLRLEFSRHVPGMLTALGIVGTFGGLIGGLSGFERTNLETSIQNLLTGIHSAFSVSFIAILGAVIVTGVERFTCTWLYGHVQQLQEGLNRRFNRTLTDGYLKDISDLSGQTTQTLKSFSQDLSEAIRQAMQQLVAQQTTAMAEANALIAEQVKQALQDVMEPAMGRLASAVESAQQQNANSSQEALRDLVGQFGDAMQQTTGRQMDGLMAAISGSTQTISALRDEMGTLLTAVQEQMKAQQSMSAQQIESLSAYAAGQQATLQQELKAFVTDTARTLQDLQQKMLEHSGASITGVGTELTRLVADFQQRQEEALERLEGRMGRMHEALDAKLTNVMSELSSASREGASAMQGAVQQTLHELHAQQAHMLSATHRDVSEAMQGLAQQTTGVLQASETLSRRLEVQSADLHEAVRALVTQSQATHSDVAAQQARYAAQLNETMGALNALMGDFDARVARHRGLVDEMAAALGAARGAAEHIATAAGRFADTQGRVDALLERVTSHTALLQREVEALRQFNQQLEGTVHAHGRSLNNLRLETDEFMSAVNQGVTAFAETVDQSMQRYHAVATTNLDRYFGKVDEHMGKAVELLGGSISELEESLSTLDTHLRGLRTR